MRGLYPEITPRRTRHLGAGSVHEVYIEESGNPSGIPVLFIHGGPGSGSTEKHRRHFDPARYRIVNFDQRGCNRSRPRGDTRDNTTQDLLSDIDLIRQTLDIENWVMFGGSWGATLALLYAERHPRRVAGLVLRGTFLARREDLDWFVKDGVNRILPEAWDRFRGHIPAGEWNDLVSAYHRRVHGDDPVAAGEAAEHWAAWSARTVCWQLNLEQLGIEADLSRVLDEVRIETHYAKHRYFIEENQILANAGTLPPVPVTIIHGRRDLTCTLDASWALHRALPRSEFIVVRDGGHLAGEPVMTDALVRATDAMAGLVGGGC